MVFLLLVLPGCSLLAPKQPDIIIEERPVRVVCETSRRPDILNLKDTPPTLVMNPDEVWGYWFNSELYAALAENLQSMKTWMIQSTAIRGALVDCIGDHNESVEPEDPAE